VTQITVHGQALALGKQSTVKAVVEAHELPLQSACHHPLQTICHKPQSSSHSACYVIRSRSTLRVSQGVINSPKTHKTAASLIEVTCSTALAAHLSCRMYAYLCRHVCKTTVKQGHPIHENFSALRHGFHPPLCEVRKAWTQAVFRWPRYTCSPAD
jgi:hypothetical protein